MEYILTANALYKQYGHYKVLNGFDLNVPRGAIYGLVGKNGAGKTTFIRIICGLQKPDAGDFTLYGTKGGSREIIQARRRMGAVVETPSLYLDMSAEDNLKMQYRILGMPTFEGIEELLLLVGLPGVGKKKAGHFRSVCASAWGLRLHLLETRTSLCLMNRPTGLTRRALWKSAN